MSICGMGIETSSPPVLPIISPWVMYLRRSVLIFPRTICLNRFWRPARFFAPRPCPLAPLVFGRTPRAGPPGAARLARDRGGPAVPPNQRTGKGRRAGADREGPTSSPAGRGKRPADSPKQIVFRSPSGVQVDQSPRAGSRPRSSHEGYAGLRNTVLSHPCLVLSIIALNTPRGRFPPRERRLRRSSEASTRSSSRRPCTW